MAIDSAAKRFSIMLEPGLMPYPPSGSFGVAGRIDMLDFYRGIAPLSVDPLTDGAAYHVFGKAIDDGLFASSHMKQSNFKQAVGDSMFQNRGS